MAIRIEGTILGISTGDAIAPLSQVTIQLNAPANGQFVFLTGVQAVLNQLAVGQNMVMYLATSGAEQTAIEGVVTATPVGTSD